MKIYPIAVEICQSRSNFCQILKRPYYKLPKSYKIHTNLVTLASIDRNRMFLDSFLEPSIILMWANPGLSLRQFLAFFFL